MTKSPQQSAAVPAAAINAPRTVAVIDDAFIPITLERITDAASDDILAILAMYAAALEAEGFADVTDAGAILDGLMDHLPALTDLYVALTSASPELDRMLAEARALKLLVCLIEEQAANAVVQCRPDKELPDLTNCDLVLIDFYLEGGNRESELSKEKAREVTAQHKKENDQQIVLMSSFENIRDSRAKFRSDASLVGASFAFIAKADMDERWKVKAHLGMLDRARPHAAVLENYRATLNKGLEEAKTSLLQLANDLDIGDYAYLQSQALMTEGHPLGDYVSWLLASHMTTLAFETPLMRETQGKVDRLEFESKAFTPTEPSPVVAELFHSALLASNLGPLAPHPRAKAGGEYDKYPVVQLGDVFMDAACTKAVVVMSADCDLAFSPTKERAPKDDHPVLLLPGTPKAFDQKDGASISSVGGVIVSGRVYRIDWSFSGYRSRSLGDLAAWLTEEGFDTQNRNRLRPLYGLKLQQEFGAHLLRVGPPVMPPLTYAAEGRLYRCINGAKNLVEEFVTGEVMLSHHDDATELRLTPKLVDALRRTAQDIRNELQGEWDHVADGEKKPRGLKEKIEALTRDIEDDELWIHLVNGVPLLSVSTMKEIKSVCGFVQGKDWALPSKPRAVFEVVERAIAVVIKSEPAPA